MWQQFKVQSSLVGEDSIRVQSYAESTSYAVAITSTGGDIKSTTLVLLSDEDLDELITTLEYTRYLRKDYRVRTKL